MAHRSLFRFALVFVLTTSLVKSQRIFQSPIRPLYFVQRAGVGDDGRNPSNPHLPRESAYRRSDEEESVPKARSDIAADSSEEDQDDAGSSEAAPAPRRNTTTLPRNFDEVVRANGPQDDDGPQGPLYGDPAVMEEDEDEHERSRFLWPFQSSITITKQKRLPHHHHHHPPPHHHLSDYAPGFPKPPLLPPHLTQQNHGPHDLEYEKTRLKYEIYKLKAKKTIAILQNKVELKKILSLLLQQKIKALEWITWYHDYVEQMFNQANGNGNGWGWGDEGDGWGESKYLTDEEIVHTKGRKSSYSWSSLFGGGLLSQLRTSLNLDDSQEKNSAAPVPITIQPIFPSSQQPNPQVVYETNDPNVQAKPLIIRNNNNNNNNNRKPFYYSIFSSPLLKYLGYQKDDTMSSPAPSPNQLRHDIPTQNNSPPPPPPPRPHSSEDSDENPGPSSREGPSEDDDDDNNDDDHNGNDEEYDGRENNSDGPDEDDDAKSDENKKNVEENPEEEQEDEEEDDKQGEEEDEKQEEEDEEEEEKPEEDAKTKPKKIKNASPEEDTTAASVDIISEEHKDEDDADDEDEDDDEEDGPVNRLNIDIDEELKDIPIPGQHGQRGRRPPPPSNSLADKLFRTGVKPPPTPTPRPTKSDKKKASLKNKVYTFLFKTMDVIDKKYMTGGDAEVDELLEARKLQPEQKQEEEQVKQ